MKIEIPKLRHPVAIACAVVVIPTVAVITIVVRLLKAVGLCAPSVWWRKTADELFGPLS